MKKKTAILIFTQTASWECKNKYFPKGLELFSELNNQVLNKVKKTGLPYFIITEKEQKGSTFGERYTNAIEFVFKKGFFNIITIGNDTPELKSQQLNQAAANLNKSKTTIGPTLDGGFYILAISKSQFDKTTFLNLPWQKKSLRKELVKTLESTNTSIITLCFYNDLDSQKDIKHYLSYVNLISKNIFLLIQNIVSLSPKTKGWNVSQNTFTFILFNKGSPLVS